MSWNFAVVAATLLGPVFAVQVQKYLERWRDETERRKRVFKTLMATRAARLSQAHVEALNLINLLQIGSSIQATGTRRSIKVPREFIAQSKSPIDGHDTAMVQHGYETRAH